MGLLDELQSYRLAVRKVGLERLPSAHVREWDGIGRADVVGRISQLSDADENVRASDVPGLEAFIAVRSLCEPDGALVFTTDQEGEMLAKLAGEDIKAIAEAAMDLNGLGAEAVEAAAGKS